jgi:hypothetical protein
MNIAKIRGNRINLYSFPWMDLDYMIFTLKNQNVNGLGIVFKPHAPRRRIPLDFPGSGLEIHGPPNSEP